MVNENEAMVPDRFRTLIEAYGASVDRWPAQERVRAEPLLLDPQYRSVLSGARTVDRFLDEWMVPAPSQDLADRVTTSAPASIFEHFARWRLWLSGVGLAAAMAGAVAGSVIVAALSPTDSGWLPLTTAFGDLSE